MSNNMFSEYISYSKKCLQKYAKKIIGSEYNQEIFDVFLKVYIDARYYNAAKDYENGFLLNIVYNLREQYDRLTGGKEDKKIEYAFKVFKFLLYFDNVREAESAKKIIDEIEDFRKNELDISGHKNFKTDFFNLVQEDLISKKVFLESFSSKDFSVALELTNVNELYNCVLESNLQFPTLYDKKSIKKIFKSKDLDEDKLLIQYLDVSSKALFDVIKGDFLRKYLVEFSPTLFAKPIKMEKSLVIMDNDIAKEKIIIKITFSDFLNNKEKVYSKIRVGYKFALIIDEEFSFSVEDQEYLKIFKYFIISSNSSFKNEFVNYENVVILR